MYNPHRARSVDHWWRAAVGKISPITAVNYPPPASPPSTPGIVDKSPTFLGRSKGETHIRSRLWGGFLLRDSPLGCYSTTIAHTPTLLGPDVELPFWTMDLSSDRQITPSPCRLGGLTTCARRDGVPWLELPIIPILCSLIRLFLSLSPFPFLSPILVRSRSSRCLCLRLHVPA